MMSLQNHKLVVKKEKSSNHCIQDNFKSQVSHIIQKPMTIALSKLISLCADDNFKVVDCSEAVCYHSGIEIRFERNHREVIYRLTCLDRALIRRKMAAYRLSL